MASKPEISEAALRALIDAGDLNAVEQALREQTVRLSLVLKELDRVIELGKGNLATVLVTMLICRFRVANAGLLAQRALTQHATTGVEELCDLGAALLEQNRLSLSETAIETTLERQASHGRALYLKARICARRGQRREAFACIRRVSPDLLGATGLALQARYAALNHEISAAKGALQKAKTLQDENAISYLDHVQSTLERIQLSALDPSVPQDLRNTIFIEYGCLLLEQSQEPVVGVFPQEAPVQAHEIGQLIDRFINAVRTLGVPLVECFYANEDGEIIAAAIHQRANIPYREWRMDRDVQDGAWLCMGSAATHPHLPNQDVRALQAVLDQGILRTMATLLPVGARGPIVPDIVGRLVQDDELPWTFDDEVDDVLLKLFDSAYVSGIQPQNDLSSQGDLLLVERFGGLLRAATPRPGPPPTPFFDELPQNTSP